MILWVNSLRDNQYPRIQIVDPKQNQAMLELNSVFKDLMSDSPPHPDGSLAGVEIR